MCINEDDILCSELGLEPMERCTECIVEYYDGLMQMKEDMAREPQYEV